MNLCDCSSDVCSSDLSSPFYGILPYSIMVFNAFSSKIEQSGLYTGASRRDPREIRLHFCLRQKLRLRRRTKQSGGLFWFSLPLWRPYRHNWHPQVRRRATVRRTVATDLSNLPLLRVTTKKDAQNSSCRTVSSKDRQRSLIRGRFVCIFACGKN